MQIVSMISACGTPLRERDEREDDCGKYRADLRDQAEEPRDDAEREREGDTEEPGRRALHRARDRRDRDRAERVAADRPRDPLLEDPDPLRLVRVEHAVERPREVRQVDHEEEGHEADRQRPEPEPEHLAAELERVAELRREVGRELLGAPL